MKKIILILLLSHTLFATAINLSSGVALSGNVIQGEMVSYKITTTSSTQQVDAILDQLVDDADFYLKVGSPPTTSTYDCRSIRTGTQDENCSIFVDDNNTDVYVNVYGYKATSYQIKATLNVGVDPVMPLTSGVPLTESIQAGETKYYKIGAGNGQNVASIIDQLSDDADIYIKIGSKPTGSIYDCKSTQGGTNSDACDVNLSNHSDVFIAVYGFKTATYTVKATVTGDIINLVNLTSGVSESTTIPRDETHYYVIHVDANQTFTVLLNQLSGDADLWVQIDEQPTNIYKACSSSNGGTTSETCQFSLLTEADVYIGVYGFRSADYTVTATLTATPIDSNMIEDGENGLNTSWQTTKGPYAPILYDRPNVPLAPPGTKVIIFPLDSAPGQVEYYTSYSIPVNDSIHKVLEVDLGGTPNYNIPYFVNRGQNLPGYMIHYSLGVEVETMLGTRRMGWDSFYTHNGAGAHKGVGNWLEYGSPAEMVRGWIRPREHWNHFKVNLEEQLQLLEPNNRIVKVNSFYTLGGSLDNIKLSTQ